MSPINSDAVIKVIVLGQEHFFKIMISDHGSGLSNYDNLFVPFYSTKKQGSGIGLVLCRQIIEAHNGRLTLTNRSNTQGCDAIIEFPIK